MLICMSAVLHLPVLCMQLYFFGMRNQLLLLYMDAPFFYSFAAFWRQISIFFYLDAYAQHLLEDYDDLQILIKMM